MKSFHSYPTVQGTGAKQATKVIALTKQLKQLEVFDKEPVSAFITEIDGVKSIVIQKVGE